MRLAVLLSVLLVSGCSTLKVGADYDAQAEFTSYRTWAFVGGHTNSPQISKEMLERRLVSALTPVLAAKGLTLGAEAPDLQVSYFAAVEEKIHVSGYTTSYHHWQGNDTYVTTYDEGTLILDLVDAKQKRLIWRGTAQDYVDLLAAPEEREAQLREVVQKLFENYPPGKAKP